MLKKNKIDNGFYNGSVWGKKTDFQFSSVLNRNALLVYCIITYLWHFRPYCTARVMTNKIFF